MFLVVIACVMMVIGLQHRDQPGIAYVFPPVSVLLILLASGMQCLGTSDEGDHLLIQFGPLPLFRRRVRYDDIVSAEADRTTLLEGWGIHMSLRGGWVWNIWGRDCVRLQLRSSVLRVGTDDVEGLLRFLSTRIPPRSDNESD